MKICSLSDIFDIPASQPIVKQKGIQQVEEDGINYVSAITGNNGIKMKVRKYIEVIEGKKGGCTIPIDGHAILCTFLQHEPFYCSELVRVIYPKDESMSVAERLYYCMCIRSSKFKYSYGKKPLKDLPFLKVPQRESVPSWIYDISENLNVYDFINAQDFGFSIL